MGNGGFEIGLDEAGYGPLLGPLVIGAVRIDGPLHSLKDALRTRRRTMPRILDSKVLYKAGAGFADLERAALSAWAVARGKLPATVGEYFGDEPPVSAEHPWYGNLADPLPRALPRAEVEDAAAALHGELGRRGAALAEAHAFCHLEGVLNARMSDLDNKADVHLDHIGRAMMRVLGGLAPGRVNCDRLGGRQDYGPFLSRLFPFVPMAAEHEEPAESRYAVGPADGATVVRFMVNGERRSKEVALASCLAKYGRELMMECFNRTFTTAYGGLKPTAGYYGDARRFLRELEAAAGADAGWKGRLIRRR
jgi:ribonuclease HII